MRAGYIRLKYEGFFFHGLTALPSDARNSGQPKDGPAPQARTDCVDYAVEP
jgi:hypothetical protein